MSNGLADHVGLRKIRHSHRFVAVVIQFLIPLRRSAGIGSARNELNRFAMFAKSGKFFYLISVLKHLSLNL